MLVSAHELKSLHSQVTMVSGLFDPLHPGHVEYFRAAADLGFPLLCNVSPDGELGAKRHPPLLTQEERARVIDAIRYVDYTHAGESTTAAVLELLRPRIFAKGVDWVGRLPNGETDACSRLGIDIAFLDTKLASSSAIVERFLGSATTLPA
jgi:cytidyltransferase-like protein